MKKNIKNNESNKNIINNQQNEKETTESQDGIFSAISSFFIPVSVLNN